MAKVRVDMRMCDKVHDIEVRMNEEGGFDLIVETDCPHVRDFADALPTLDMMDLVDKPSSKVFLLMREMEMSATCLFPSGVLSAAWLEAGLWASSRAREKGMNCVIFPE